MQQVLLTSEAISDLSERNSLGHSECSQTYTKRVNTLCRQKVEYVNVKPGGA